MELVPLRSGAVRVPPHVIHNFQVKAEKPVWYAEFDPFLINTPEALDRAFNEIGKGIFVCENDVTYDLTYIEDWQNLLSASKDYGYGKTDLLLFDESRRAVGRAGARWV